jgi:hypothetical protein
MITIFIISLLIAIISTVRIEKTCREEGIQFNPLQGSLLEWLGFFWGWVFAIYFFIEYSIIKYLL